MTPILSELREPPVPGRYYLVPTVRYVYARVDAKPQHWPVLGPCHHDRELIKFEALHYHIDTRFLSSRRMRANRPISWLGNEDVGHRYYVQPLSELAPEHRQSWNEGLPFPRQPTLRKLMCRRTDHAWPVHNKRYAEAPETWGLNRHYGSPALAIHRPDGRILCPHRKVDLSQFPQDDQGITICPLHGLAVQCNPTQKEGITHD